MKSLLPLLLLMPVPPILLYTAEYVLKGSVPPQYAALTAGIALLGWGGAVLEARATKNRVRNQVHLDIHQNLIVASDGARVTGEYSSKSHFVSNLGQLQDALEKIANRAFEKSNKLVAFKESAYIRLRPGDLTISQLELQAIIDLADSLFIEPTVEVADETTAMLDDPCLGLRA